MREPDTFLGGFPKSGTTTLHGMLVGHPDVAGTRVKEPSLYSSTRNYAAGERYVRSVMPNVRSGRILDATPWYAVVPAAMERMSIVLAQPRTRVLLLLRDPVDRAHSMYWDQVAAGHERRSVTEALLHPSSDSRPHDQADARTAYVWGSRSELHVPRFEAAVGSGRLLLLSTEHLAGAHIDSTWVRVLSFLDLREAPVPTPMVKNRTTAGRSPGLTALLNSRPSSALRRVARWLPHEVRLSLGEWLTSLGREKSGTYPPLEDPLRQQLVLRLEEAAVVHRSVLPGRD